MRGWLAILLVIFGVAAARAISPAQQIIIFGDNSSASGGGGGGCTPTGLLFNIACNSQYIPLIH